MLQCTTRAAMQLNDYTQLHPHDHVRWLAHSHASLPPECPARPSVCVYVNKRNESPPRRRRVYMCVCACVLHVWRPQAVQESLLAEDEERWEAMDARWRRMWQELEEQVRGRCVHGACQSGPDLPRGVVLGEGIGAGSRVVLTVIARPPAHCPPLRPNPVCKDKARPDGACVCVCVRVLKSTRKTKGKDSIRYAMQQRDGIRNLKLVTHTCC